MDDENLEKQPIEKDEENVVVQDLSENEGAVSPDSQALLEEVESLKDQLLRALAETDNIRKRATREQDETRKYAVTSFAKDILSISDNLNRAFESIPQGESSSTLFQNLVNGIKMIQDAFQEVCKRHGIEKIQSLHEKFDPHLHQAMLEIEGLDDHIGVVVQVMQDGYTLHGRLLRPALVGVGKASGSTNAQQTEGKTS